MTDLRPGTIECEAVLSKVREDNAATQREREQLEQRLPSLQGKERTAAAQRLSILETKCAVELGTIERLTFDRDKQMRAGVFSEDEAEILKEIDGVPFSRSSSLTWLSFGVDASADRKRLDSIAIAISRLKTAAAHARMMEHIRTRALAAPLDPNEPMVW